MFDAEFRNAINQQLQVTCTPREYLSEAEGAYNDLGTDHVPYWRKLSEYTVSRCPICQTPYQQVLDTYSLLNWGIYHADGTVVSYSMYGYKRCDHFVAAHTFLNLDGQVPRQQELANKILTSTEPEIPMITPALLPDDIESYGVLHTLPICRIEKDSFVPRYLFFILTYYAVDVETVKMRRMLEWTGGVHLRYNTVRPGIYWEEADNKPEVWDLALWVQKGKLRWLNPFFLELPLESSPDAFPYNNLTGLKHGYVYEKRNFKIRRTHTTIETYRKNLPSLLEGQERAYELNKSKGQES